jgi:hypothetical protein
MADTPEKKMKRKVDAVLNAYGIWFFSPQSGIYGKSGIPDRVGILPGGRVIAVEVKGEKAARGLTALQEKTLVAMANQGGMIFVVDSEQALIGMDAALRLAGFKKRTA